MSTPRFASITASLLARKGDAAPSLAAMPPRPSAFGDGEAPFPPPPPRSFATQPPPRPLPHDDEEDADAAMAPPPPALAADDHGDRPRRIMITLSAEDFERLSIAAIKKDCSRHAVVQAALMAYFHQLAAELPRRCACMADGPCCR